MKQKEKEKKQQKKKNLKKKYSVTLDARAVCCNILQYKGKTFLYFLYFKQ